VVTGCESWFILSWSPAQMWVLSKDLVGRIEESHQQEKFMVAIISNPCGFRVFNVLLNGPKFNTTHLLDKIVTPLYSTVSPIGRKRQERKVSLHLIDCSIHKSRENQEIFERNQIKNFSQLLYSPDTAADHFFGFDM
jgi:hypothetical protein